MKTVVLAVLFALVFFALCLSMIFSIAYALDYDYIGELKDFSNEVKRFFHR